MSKLIPHTIDESIFLKENERLHAINAELLEALEDVTAKAKASLDEWYWDNLAESCEKAYEIMDRARS